RLFALGVAPENERAARAHIAGHSRPKAASEYAEELIVQVADDVLGTADHQLKPIEHSEVVLACAARQNEPASVKVPGAQAITEGLCLGFRERLRSAVLRELPEVLPEFLVCADPQITERLIEFQLQVTAGRQ